MLRSGIRMHDTLGAGGNIASGDRIVRKGGRIKFDHFFFSHEKLLSYVGKYVYISDPEDAFFSEKIRVDTLEGMHICYARNDYKRPS